MTSEAEVEELRRRVAELEDLLANRQVVRQRLGDLMIDRLTRVVTSAGLNIPLRAKEFALLSLLARHPEKPRCRADLERSISTGRAKPGVNVVAVHMSRLRAKLRGTGVEIVTERGRGYRLTMSPVPPQKHLTDQQADHSGPADQVAEQSQHQRFTV